MAVATLVFLEEHLPEELGHKSQAYSCVCILDHVMATFELRRESGVLVSSEQSSSYFSQDSELYLHCDPTVLSRVGESWDLGEPVCVSSKARRRLGDVTGKSQHNHYCGLALTISTLLILDLFLSTPNIVDRALEKVYFLIKYVYGCFACVYVQQVVCRAQRGQKRGPDPLELELQVAVS